MKEKFNSIWNLYKWNLRKSIFDFSGKEMNWVRIEEVPEQMVIDRINRMTMYDIFENLADESWTK